MGPTEQFLQRHVAGLVEMVSVWVRHGIPECLLQQLALASFSAVVSPAALKQNLQPRDQTPFGRDSVLLERKKSLELSECVSIGWRLEFGC